MTWHLGETLPLARTGSGPVLLAGNPVAPPPGAMPGFQPGQAPAAGVTGGER